MKLLPPRLLWIRLINFTLNAEEENECLLRRIYNSCTSLRIKEEKLEWNWSYSQCLDVFQFLDFLADFFRVLLQFLQIIFWYLVPLVVSSVFLLLPSFSCSLSVRHLAMNKMFTRQKNTAVIKSACGAFTLLIP